MLVVDASTMVKAVLDKGFTGRRLRARMVAEGVAVPSVHDLEVVSGIRGNLLRRVITIEEAESALTHFAELDLDRYHHRPLLSRVWTLRDNLTAYDAAYVALAEALDAVLLTSDRRLTRAPGIRCDVELVTGP